MCFYYDTLQTFHILEEKNYLVDVFSIWFEKLQTAKFEFDIKRMILGIANIISKIEEAPQMIRDGINDIMAQMVLLSKKSVQL